MRPAHPRRRLCAGAGVLVLAEAGGFLRFRLIVPVLPPLRLDVPAEVALAKSDGGVGAPRPAAKRRRGAVCANLTPRKDARKWPPLPLARRAHEPAVLALDRAVLEYRRRFAEDEIDAPLDVAVLEVS